MPRRRGNTFLPSIDRVVNDSARRATSEVHVFEVKHLPEQNLGLIPPWMFLLGFKLFGIYHIKTTLFCIDGMDCGVWLPTS